MAVRILTTGGTIDKVYDEISGALLFRNSHLEQIIKQGRCKLDISLESNLVKDSLEMDARDREQVLDACMQCSEDRIIITHGTDTIVETAGLVGRNILNKTIVLTGAMRPYSMGDSDAVFNLGFALAGVQILPPGVYIAMNGLFFPWDNVRKNCVQGVFEHIAKEEV